MKTLFCGLCALFLAGCCSVSGTRTLPDGGKLEISSLRFIWQTEGLNATVTDANGFSFTLRTQKSSVDVEALKASGQLILEAVSKAKP